MAQPLAVLERQEIKAAEVILNCIAFEVEVLKHELHIPWPCFALVKRIRCLGRAESVIGLILFIVLFSGGSGSGAGATGRQETAAGDTNKAIARCTRNRLAAEGGAEAAAKGNGKGAKAQANGNAHRRGGAAEAEGLDVAEGYYKDDLHRGQDLKEEEDVGQEVDPVGFDEDCELDDGMAGADGISAREGLSGDRALKEDEASTAPVPKKVSSD